MVDKRRASMKQSAHGGPAKPLTLAKARRDTAADVAAEALMEAIIEGAIPAGAPLRLQEVADRLGMSMMPVREALRRLASLDLVEIEPHKGARVREVSLEDLTDTYYTRLWLESLAVREAAARFTVEDLRVAETALADHANAMSAGDRVSQRNAHERFHFAVYGASGHPWLVRSLLPTWRNSERYRVESMRHPESQVHRDAEHKFLLEAVARGDADAAVGHLVAHLRTSVELVADALAGSGGTDGLLLPSTQELLGRASEAPSS